MRKAIGTIVVLFALVTAGYGAAVALGDPPPGGPPGQGECEHGNSQKPCRPDPQPDHGKDCEEHGPFEGGVNEDHCLGTTTTTTTETTTTTTTTEEEPPTTTTTTTGTTTTDTTTTQPPPQEPCPPGTKPRGKDGEPGNDDRPCVPDTPPVTVPPSTQPTPTTPTTTEPPPVETTVPEQTTTTSSTTVTETTGQPTPPKPKKPKTPTSSPKKPPPLCPPGQVQTRPCAVQGSG